MKKKINCHALNNGWNYGIVLHENGYAQPYRYHTNGATNANYQFASSVPVAEIEEALGFTLTGLTSIPKEHYFLLESIFHA
jgi:hypothetical protein